MPYLPLPPSQPPPIVQPLPPEENSSTSASASPTPSAPKLELTAQTQAPRFTASSATITSPAGTAVLGPPSTQAASTQLPYFTSQALSSGETLDPKTPKRISASTPKPKGSDLSANSESKQPPATQSEHSSHGIGSRESLESHADWKEYRRIRQALSETGNALISSNLASEVSLESNPFSSPKSSATTGSLKPLSRAAKELDSEVAVNLLKQYGLEQGLTAEQLTQQWQQSYPSSWIRPALIEAIYQGRHKAVSVERILAAWQRRGQPLYHFDPEFEHLISNQLAQKQFAKTDQLLQKKQQAPVANTNAEDAKVRPPDNLPQSFAQKTPTPDDAKNPVVPTQQGTGDGAEEPLELYSDRQEYNDVSRIFTAAGNVLLRFRDAVLRADQLEVNLRTQLAVARGNVSLIRGQQELQGDRLEYNYAQNRGNFLKARGNIFLPTATTDISTTNLPGEGGGSPTDDIDADEFDDIYPDDIDEQPILEELEDSQPPRSPQSTDVIQRLRFEAEQIEFDGRGWQAQTIRITNDPFSPPELEVRADKAQLVRVSPQEDRVEATRPRLVFDQGLSLPILRSKVILDRRRRDPVFAQIGYDGSDRGGLFIGRTFEPILTDQSRLAVTPQFFLQRAIEENGFNIVDPDLYGVNVRFNSTFGPQTSLTGVAALTGLDPTQIGDNLRASLELQQPIGTPIGTHGLTVGYAYRDETFNGSLGLLDIQNNVGAVLTSPTFLLGSTGLRLNYQVGTRFVTAETDQSGLDDPASLGRFRASASLRREFPIWQGQALPATAAEGLRYTPEPVVPYLQVFTRLTGTVNAYTSGDTQHTLLGKVGLRGQFGQFSRSFLDYTGFSVSLAQTGRIGLSPFLFDRAVDLTVLSAGIFQQVYGPIRVGAEVSLNLSTGNAFETEYLIDYSRRTYGVTLRYNSSRAAGSINFRISGFNWIGGTEAFYEP